MKTRPQLPVITLLTDFGLSDHYVAAMKGVMLGICPGAQMVDISHGVAPYAITEAAYTLAQAWQCFPLGTVHLVVVDPGVGSARRPILAEAAGHYFVAPDNGVLSILYAAEPARAVRHIVASRYFRNPVSHTFHGRDIFAPVAAYLAHGVQSAEFGEIIGDYQRLAFAHPVSTGPHSWTGTVLKIDRFGNLVTNFASAAFERIVNESFEITVGNHHVSRLAASYAEMEPGCLFAIPGSAGYLEISCNQESAARVLRCVAGGVLSLTTEPARKVR
jgi:hypothetical protein